ncbi:hypothetical protein HWB19_gp045 [Cronobacter phage vB_CsaP_009]|uniref:Uncharacterized protein n=1 Tax=Cronobacter phage vB_CsaP_009 TaxID=2699738 RepID=A0A679FGA1_9CAUD|nr:hypothetical protein HWB19_gp045 [Cronobacter phage vB_CsaP_009]BBU72691.1 hypothetical protein [Cronobacter phage vB_CsaP_009]
MSGYLVVKENKNKSTRACDVKLDYKTVYKSYNDSPAFNGSELLLRAKNHREKLGSSSFIDLSNMEFVYIQNDFKLEEVGYLDKVEVVLENISSKGKHRV